MASLNPRDVVLVTKLDQLGRSTRELARKAVFLRRSWLQSRSLSAI
jgi:hypothetical protein